MTANLTPEQFASTAFDYIVVGGGTAGLVVAVRYVLRIDAMLAFLQLTPTSVFAVFQRTQM